MGVKERISRDYASMKKFLGSVQLALRALKAKMEVQAGHPAVFHHRPSQAQAQRLQQKNRDGRNRQIIKEAIRHLQPYDFSQ